MRKSRRAVTLQYERARAVADELIARLGEQAPCHAMHQALKARLKGDRPRMDEWLWIAGAAREILRSEPKG
jgi:cobyrinic acid a,c-diamide synthase